MVIILNLDLKKKFKSILQRKLTSLPQNLRILYIIATVDFIIKKNG